MDVINFYKSFLIVIVLVVIISSCRKFVEIEAPKNQMETSQVFENDAAATSAVVGLYSKISSSLFLTSGAEALYTGLSADEIVNTSPNSSLDPFSQNSLIPSHITLLNFWQTAYPSIYHCNAVLEGLEKSKSLSEGIRRQLRGEMLVVRSLIYFYMVQLFGDVPFITSTDYAENSKAERSDRNKVVQYIENDLKGALELLIAKYSSVNRGRPNKWTAAALLSRVYLFEGKIAEADDQASAIINSGNYSLNNLISNVFTGSSNETIWQWIRDKNNTAIAISFVPSSASTRPGYIITDYLLTAFEPGDLRKKNWISSNTVGGQAYYYPYKYKSRAASPINEYYIVFRLAEQYLIRAEARVMQGNTIDAVADLNVIRKRAGLANLPLTLTKDEVLLAVDQERRVELFTEGHRWFDLIRSGKADGILSVVKGASWQPTDKLYPIPESEILKNPALTQNPGY